MNEVDRKDLEAKLAVLEADGKIKKDAFQKLSWSPQKEDYQKRNELYNIWAEVDHQITDIKRQLTANPELEAVFKAAYDEATDEINKYLRDAREALCAAEKISEEKGIPFSSSVVWNGDTFHPYSMQEKWKGLSEEFFEEFNQENDERFYMNGRRGWQQSYC